MTYWWWEREGGRRGGKEGERRRGEGELVGTGNYGVGCTYPSLSSTRVVQTLAASLGIEAAFEDKMSREVGHMGQLPQNDKT